MTQANNIVSKSIAAFVGTIESVKDAARQLEYTKYNLKWLDSFDTVVYSWNGDNSLINHTISDIRDLITSPVELLYSENIGPVFGAMDNDQKIFAYAKNRHDIDYIWKFSNDTIADETILNLNLDTTTYDFFYINNIGYASFTHKTKTELVQDILAQTYFYPQTNYYIVKNIIDVWYPSYSDIIKYKNLYNETIKTNPNHRPWDVLQGEVVGLEGNQGFDCEHMLAKTIRTNKLKPCHLLNEEDTNKIVDLIYNHQIHDGSHKNILYTNVGNLCHYHIINHPVAPI